MQRLTMAGKGESRRSGICIGYLAIVYFIVISAYSAGTRYLDLSRRITRSCVESLDVEDGWKFLTSQADSPVAGRAATGVPWFGLKA